MVQTTRAAARSYVWRPAVWAVSLGILRPCPTSLHPADACCTSPTTACRTSAGWRPWWPQRPGDCSAAAGRSTLLSSADAVGPGVRVEDGVRTVRVRAWNGLESRFGSPVPGLLAAGCSSPCGGRCGAPTSSTSTTRCTSSSWVAALWCVLLRTPYVVHRHVGFVHHSFARRTAWCSGIVLGTLRRAVLRRAAAVLPIDEYIAAGMRAAVARRRGSRCSATASTQPASARRRRASAAGPARTFGLPQDRPLALFVGRFVPKKGFAQVAAAASDGYELVFVGGDRPPGWTTTRLHFLGGGAGRRDAAGLRCADVMVVASVGECPLTVLEAMSSGLPGAPTTTRRCTRRGPRARACGSSTSLRAALRAALEDLVEEPGALRRIGRGGTRIRAHVLLVGRPSRPARGRLPGRSLRAVSGRIPTPQDFQT